MDGDSERTSEDVPLSAFHGRVTGGLATNHPAACVMCRRFFAPDSDDLETISICGDCKFLLLEDVGDSAYGSFQRRPHRGRRNRHSSSESVDNLFSQQLSNMINVIRQNHTTGSVHDSQSLDEDASGRLFPHMSSRTTPTGSRRRRLILSDTESEGYDNLDSVYGDNETTPSVNWQRGYHGDSDAISFSYGGDSDASVDGHSFLDTEIFVQPEDESNFDSDTDIDPMHAGGLNHWNVDDEEDGEEEEEEEDDDGGEWEEADIEEDTNESVAGSRFRNYLISSPNEGNGSNTWRQQFDSPFEALINWRRRRHGSRQASNRDIFARLETPDVTARYVGNSGDYLDARGFEELLQHLAETDNSRRGAPPAAMSFVNSLPLVTIAKEHVNHDDLTCAICKEVLSIGTEVNQLPCFHLYHPSCILPWLSTRNSCPLCRFELPTDDKDYEEKRSNSNRVRVREIQQQDASEDSSSDVSDGAAEAGEWEAVLRMYPALSSSEGEGSRSRWFLLAAAAPIVSLVGIVLVFWLGNSQGRGGASTHNCNLTDRGLNQINVGGLSATNQRGNRSRRWWWFF